METRKKALVLKKLKAKRLYVNQLVDAKTTAGTVGISEKTIGKWVREGNWKGAREKTAEQIAGIGATPLIPEIILKDFIEFIGEKAAHLANNIEPLANEYLKISFNHN